MEKNWFNILGIYKYRYNCICIYIYSLSNKGIILLILIYHLKITIPLHCHMLCMFVNLILYIVIMKINVLLFLYIYIYTHMYIPTFGFSKIGLNWPHLCKSLMTFYNLSFQRNMLNPLTVNIPWAPLIEDVDFKEINTI